MARSLDKKEAAVNAGVLDVALTLCSEFFAEVCRVLVFDVLDDRIPAAGVNNYYVFGTLDDIPSIIIDLVAVPGSIDDVKPQAHAVLLDDCKS